MKDRAFISGWKRAALTALLAYALVLQALLLSFGGALHAAEATGPQAFICAQDGETTPDHSPAPSHNGWCCSFGCHGSGAGGPAPAFASPLRLSPVALDASGPESLSIAHPSSDVLPVGSRAPPRLG